MRKTSMIKLRHKADFLMRQANTDVNESFFLEMNSDGEISIKGSKKIKDYTDNKIFIESDDYYITVSGTDLFLKNYSENETCISGETENISFVKRGGKSDEKEKYN